MSRQLYLHTVLIWWVICSLFIDGNIEALDTIEKLAAKEELCTPPLLVFNGDFNWFNASCEDFCEINERILFSQSTIGNSLERMAICGNVESEITNLQSEDGCGCAYPDYMPDNAVDRSNRIMVRLKQGKCIGYFH